MKRILILAAISFFLCSTASAYQGGGGESTKKGLKKKKADTKKKASGTKSDNTAPPRPLASPAPVPAEPEPVPATAELTIHSTPPNSSILIDGQSIGVTDEEYGLLRLPSLKPGKHLIIGRKERYRDARLSIVLEANRNQTAHLNLSPMPGTLNVNLNVSGARIEINEHGNYADKVSDLELDAGNYSIKASKPGYRTATQTVDIKAGLHSEVSLALELAVEEILAEAEREFHNQHYREVIAIGQDILTNKADHPRANWLIGQSYFKIQKYNESIPYLAKAISLGEEVVLKIKYDYAVPPYHYLHDGVVIVSNTAVAFDVTIGDGSFAVNPDKILELTNQPHLASRVHVKVAIKNKEDKKDVGLYNTRAATVGSGPGGTGLSLECNGCDDSMSVLYELLSMVRSSSTTPSADLAASVPGKYISKGRNSSDYLELKTDGTFYLHERSRTLNGTYTVQGTIITFQAKGQYQYYLKARLGPLNELRVRGHTMRLRQFSFGKADPWSDHWEKQP